MEYKALFNDIKDNTIHRLYSFSGVEEFVKVQALTALKQKLIQNSFEELNYHVMDGSLSTANDIVCACETLPFMSEKKMIVVKDYPLLSSGTKKNGDEEKENLILSNYLYKLPDYNCLLFYTHGEVDQRKKITKMIGQHGRIIIFNYLEEKELLQWIEKFLKKNGKNMNRADLYFLVRMMGNKLEDIQNEMEKLVNYIGERNTITQKDIDDVITKSLEYNIFKMLQLLDEHKVNQGIILLRQMIDNGENCFGILHMIARQFRISLQAKLMLEEKSSQKDMMNQLKLPSGVVSKICKQAQHLSVKQIISALTVCMEVDRDIKAGLIKDEVALEKIVLTLYS